MIGLSVTDRTRCYCLVRQPSVGNPGPRTLDLGATAKRHFV
jgi:hypothetical protein